MSLTQASAVILAALEGVRLAAEELRLFQDLPPAGFTLFRRNLSPRYSEIRELCLELQALSGDENLPMFLAIDQEGGRVARLRAPFPNFGPALDLVDGRSDEDALLEIENIGFVMGGCLQQLGINVDFAPVLDVLSREENVAIGDRCFGRDAEAVTRRAGAFLKGLQASGLSGCLKHFPGQGDAEADTHEAGTIIRADQSLLEKRELFPFLQLLPECPMVMISHAIYPAWDPHRPASLSPTIMQDFLRGKLGYRGLIVTDDMNMKAIDQSQKPWTEAVVASVAAGADLVLVCRELERYRWAAEGLHREAQRSPAFARRLTDAADRVREVRSRFA